MTEDPTPQPDAGDPARPGPARLTPLLPQDPPKVGEFWLDARLTATPSGVAFTAHDDANTPVVLIMLSEGASLDAAARDRFAGTVDKMHIDTVIARGGHDQEEGRLGGKFRGEDDDPVGPDDLPLAPWVALAHDGTERVTAEANRVLSEVDLSWLALQGRPAGPDYQLHWIDKVQPGASRLWPLPWPGRHDRSGWVSVFVSWLLMMLLMCLFVLIAILIFQAAPPQSPPPPVPTQGTGSPPPQSTSPSPQSGSPSPQSGSPAPQSGSPSPHSRSPSPPSGSPSPQSGSPSPQSGSPRPSGSASGASPTPPSKL